MSKVELYVQRVIAQAIGRNLSQALVLHENNNTRGARAAYNTAQQIFDVFGSRVSDRQTARLQRAHRIVYQGGKR